MRERERGRTHRTQRVHTLICRTVCTVWQSCNKANICFTFSKHLWAKFEHSSWNWWERERSSNPQYIMCHFYGRIQAVNCICNYYFELRYSILLGSFPWDTSICTKIFHELFSYAYFSIFHFHFGFSFVAVSPCWGLATAVEIHLGGQSHSYSHSYSHRESEREGERASVRRRQSNYKIRNSLHTFGLRRKKHIKYIQNIYTI